MLLIEPFLSNTCNYKNMTTPEKHWNERNLLETALVIDGCSQSPNELNNIIIQSFQFSGCSSLRVSSLDSGFGFKPLWSINSTTHSVALGCAYFRMRKLKPQVAKVFTVASVMIRTCVQYAERQVRMFSQRIQWTPLLLAKIRTVWP